MHDINILDFHVVIVTFDNMYGADNYGGLQQTLGSTAGLRVDCSGGQSLLITQQQQQQQQLDDIPAQLQALGLASCLQPAASPANEADTKRQLELLEAVISSAEKAADTMSTGVTWQPSALPAQPHHQVHIRKLTC